MAKPKKPKVEFPNRPQDDKALEDGAQVARARYRRQVESAARAILEDAKSQDDPDEHIDTLISEDADSAVTYYRDAYEIVALSESTDAIEGVLGDSPSDWGATNVNDAITKIAYHAYEADLRERVDALKSEYIRDDE